MRQRQKATLVGFILISIALVLIGTAYYKVHYKGLKKTTYVLYFRGSLKGLQVGSPVTHRGIKVGEVTRIQMIVSGADRKVQIPVYVRFYQYADNRSTVGQLQALIKRGLRARLESYSLIPAVDSIEINFFPKTKIVYEKDNGKYPQIPTIETAGSFDQINDILTNVTQTMTRINKVVSSGKIEQSLATFNRALNNTSHLTNNVNNHVDPVLVELHDSLKEISSAAHSVRNLSDYLSRHPEALLQGKAKH